MHKIILLQDYIKLKHRRKQKKMHYKYILSNRIFVALLVFIESFMLLFGDVESQLAWSPIQVDSQSK